MLRELPRVQIDWVLILAVCFAITEDRLLFLCFLLFNLKNIYSCFMCMTILLTWICVLHVPCIVGIQKKAPELALELQMVVNHHEGAGNRTWVIYLQEFRVLLSTETSLQSQLLGFFLLIVWVSKDHYLPRLFWNFHHSQIILIFVPPTPYQLQNS